MDFSDVKFYGNYFTLDFYRNTVISRQCLPTRKKNGDENRNEVCTRRDDRPGMSHRPLFHRLILTHALFSFHRKDGENQRTPHAARPQAHRTLTTSKSTIQ